MELTSSPIKLVSSDGSNLTKDTKATTPLHQTCKDLGRDVRGLEKST